MAEDAGSQRRRSEMHTDVVRDGKQSFLLEGIQQAYWVGQSDATMSKRTFQGFSAMA
jgi:hypothetical protein